MEENKNLTESEKIEQAEPVEAEAIGQAESNNAQPEEPKKEEQTKPLGKKNWKLYAIIGAVAVVVIVAVVLLIALGGGNKPEETTPEETTSEITTPAETTEPRETITYPTQGDEDPKQEDVFYD